MRVLACVSNMLCGVLGFALVCQAQGWEQGRRVTGQADMQSPYQWPQFEETPGGMGAGQAYPPPQQRWRPLEEERTAPHLGEQRARNPWALEPSYGHQGPKAQRPWGDVPESRARARGNDNRAGYYQQYPEPPRTQYSERGEAQSGWPGAGGYGWYGYGGYGGYSVPGYGGYGGYWGGTPYYDSGNWPWSGFGWPMW